ncbi:MAG: hypothetical protein BWX49_01051 [Bacteroidetes bacterium ADurb.Bin008]|nr:MAG: hypothetical protein BWX49_01051 [Bacteroidetes bacterium ADurb.Bin008]
MSQSSVKTIQRMQIDKMDFNPTFAQKTKCSIFHKLPFRALPFTG